MTAGVADAVARNMRFVGHSDQGGRPDGVQIMVHRGYAYIGHMFSGGFSIVDVRDPRRPKAVNFIAAPPNTWNIHLQTHGDLLLVINALSMFSLASFADEKAYYGKSLAETVADIGIDFRAGLQVFDISQPDRPREIGFMPVDGFGLHRIWYVGGRYAYVSAFLRGFSDYIFMTIDLADPAHPREAGRYWLPGMWQAGGEKATWEPSRRVGLHHAIVADGIAYGAWRDGGLTLLDVADAAQPKLLAHRNWSPPFGGGTHTALPLPDRGLAIVADEGIADNCADGIKQTWVVDVREPTNPVTIATLPTPADDDYCAKGSHFGPHNLHENRPGSFISSTLSFVTYQNAGVRVYDTTNAFGPREVASFVPPSPAVMVDVRPNRPRVIQTCDVFVDENALLYLTDYNAGLYIVEYTGA